jgi:hypothetical protein
MSNRSQIVGLLALHIALFYLIPARADTCVADTNRAPVPAVCGRVINNVGSPVAKAEITLINDADSTTFHATSDSKGRFLLPSAPNGDYTLHATATSLHDASRQLRVTQSGQNKSCKEKIVIKLGFNVCDSFVHVKGVDKK